MFGPRSTSAVLSAVAVAGSLAGCSPLSSEQEKKITDTIAQADRIFQQIVPVLCRVDALAQPVATIVVQLVGGPGMAPLITIDNALVHPTVLAGCEAAAKQKDGPTASGVPLSATITPLVPVTASAAAKPAPS